MIRAFVLRCLLQFIALKREPNVIIGGVDNPYMKRWFVIPRNKLFNIYFHEFLRSDDDRALHDHPWWNMSWVLSGEYWEFVPHKQPGRIQDAPQITLRRQEGFIGFRAAKQAHRIALNKGPDGKELGVYTLFVTGPRFRKWGFYCPHCWRFWEDFSANPESAKGGVSEIGRGCD
jgi:hypothetical protein